MAKAKGAAVAKKGVNSTIITLGAVGAGILLLLWWTKNHGSSAPSSPGGFGGSAGYGGPYYDQYAQQQNPSLLSQLLQALRGLGGGKGSSPTPPGSASAGRNLPDAKANGFLFGDPSFDYGNPTTLADFQGAAAYESTAPIYGTDANGNSSVYGILTNPALSDSSGSSLDSYLADLGLVNPSYGQDAAGNDSPYGILANPNSDPGYSLYQVPDAGQVADSTPESAGGFADSGFAAYGGDYGMVGDYGAYSGDGGGFSDPFASDPGSSDTGGGIDMTGGGDPTDS